MLGRRRWAMGGGGAGGPGQQRLRDAQRLMVEGKFAEAAAVFDDMSQRAAQNGRVPFAITLTMQAVRAYAQAKRGDEALARARRALDLILNAGKPARATHAMPRAIAVLRANSFMAQAATLEKEAAQRLAPLGLSLQALPQGGTRSLPPTCPQCAGPLRSDEADWIDATSAECPWCGSVVKTA